MAFATVAVAELFVVFAVRSPVEPAWRQLDNAWLLWSVAGSLLIVGAAVYAPPMHRILGTWSLDPAQLGVVIGCAIAPVVSIEAAKAILRARHRSPAGATNSAAGPRVDRDPEPADAVAGTPDGDETGRQPIELPRPPSSSS